MSLKLYDDAMVHKIKCMFANTFFVNGENDFEVVAKNATDRMKVTLPYISVDRIQNEISGDYWNDSDIHFGRNLPSDITSKKGYKICGYPVDLLYQIDIVSDKREEVDDIWRELVMVFYEDSTIHVRYEDIDLDINCACFLESTSVETDYSSFEENGRLYRQRLTYEIRSAPMLFKYGYYKVLEVPFTIEGMED